MKKYIEDIIEIILEDVSCDHQVDSDGSGKRYDSIIYTLKDEQGVIKKCLSAFSKRLAERPRINLKGD